jgi:hypothetical protein
LVVGGNLTVNGSVTTVNTETILLADNIITLNSNATGTPTENAGVEVERGDLANVYIRWNETSDRWEFTNDGTNYSVIPVGSDSHYATFIGGATSIPVTHNLGTKDVRVELYDVTTSETVYSDIVRTSNSVVTISFTTTPATASIRVLISKVG